MRVWKAWLGVGVAVLIAVAACGGESSNDREGKGSDGGGAGGTTGGSGGVGGYCDCLDPCTGQIYGCPCWRGSVCTTGGTAGGGGVAGCGGGGTMDCVDPCDGQMYSPSCVNGTWTCTAGSICDAGSDVSSCPSGTVPTIEGCLSCTDATIKLGQAIESARVANAACSTADSCTLTDASTQCAGACPIAVSQLGEASFQTALAKISVDYCSDFVSECGYSTPKCAVPTLVCTAGICEAEYK